MVLKRMEPAIGVEPMTGGLRNRCSASELRWRGRKYSRCVAYASTDTGQLVSCRARAGFQPSITLRGITRGNDLQVPQQS